MFLLSFLEGIVTFISPCLLPMLPVYLSFFAGRRTGNTLLNIAGFILGFTSVFILLGAIAGFFVNKISVPKTVVNIVCGGVIVIFGLSYLEVLRLPFLYKGRGINSEISGDGFLPAFLFGAVFSISWTPCVGTFLGSALMLAARSGSAMTGILMLLCYSLGLGIPFAAAALLIEQSKNAFSFIKRHYKIINTCSGLLLVILGLLIAVGLLF